MKQVKENHPIFFLSSLRKLETFSLKIQTLILDNNSNFNRSMSQEID